MVFCSFVLDWSREFNKLCFLKEAQYHRSCISRFCKQNKGQFFIGVTGPHPDLMPVMLKRSRLDIYWIFTALWCQIYNTSVMMLYDSHKAKCRTKQHNYHHNSDNICSVVSFRYPVLVSFSRLWTRLIVQI